MKKLILLLCVSLFHTGFSQPGNLDPFFGNKGIVRTDFRSTESLYENKCQQILRSTDGSFYLVLKMNQQTLITHRLPNGDIDPTYGEGGYSVPVLMSEPKAVMQANGKIIVGGTVQSANQMDFALARYNTDGSLDNSFSGDGSLAMDFSSTNDSFFGIALQADGKIVTVGSTYNNARDNMALARFNPDGSPDNSFSGDGKVVTNLAGGAVAKAVTLQQDGKIVIAGYINEAGVISMVVARYMPAGNLDVSFGTNGFRFIASGLKTVANAIAIQNDGKIIAAGFTLNGMNTMEFMLARLNADGSLDPAFSGDGILVTPVMDNDAMINALALQTDGKIVVAGTASPLGYKDFIVARFNADGNLDNSFSGDGISLPGVNDHPTTFGTSGNSLLIQPSGKIMVAGSLLFRWYFAVAAFLPDGTLDNDFGQAGIMRDFKHAARTSFNATVVQPDGKILAAGVTVTSPEYLQFVVARYNKDGSYDNSFSEDGIVMPNFGMGGAEANAIAIQPDGKIVVAGYFWNGPFHIALIRLNPDGTPDNSFSGDGQLLTQVRDYNIATDMVIQTDGKIVVGGYTAWRDGGIDIALVRYNSDGSLDKTFSEDGMLTGYMNAGMNPLVALFVKPDGKLMTVANKESGKLALFLYNGDGSPDLTFDGDGMIIIANDGIMNTATAASLQPDGAMVVVGTKDNKFSIERLRSDGSFDNSFSAVGYRLVDFNGNNQRATSLVLQPDGKMIMGGYVKDGSFADMALARVNPDGSLDNSFSTDGKQVIELGYGGDWIQSLSIYGDRLFAAGRTTYGGELGMLAAIQLGCDLSVTIPDAITLKRGVDSNTVYQGYMPASAISLTARASGGTAPYSYRWSNGATTAAITVSPTMPATYTVTVTDASGCSQTMSKWINVVDVRCGNKMDKVLVCQVPQGKPSNAHTICINANAVTAHLNNGSRLGNCSQDAMVTRRLVEDQPGVNAHGLQVYPNPGHSSFTLIYSTGTTSLTELVIYDVTGSVLEKRTISNGKPFTFGAGYRPGVYYVQLTQGERKEEVKVIKLAR